MSIAAVLTGMNTSPWWLVVAAGVGLGAAALPLVVSRLFFRRGNGPDDANSEGPEEPERDPFIYGSPSEQRSSVRRTGGGVEVLVTDSEIKGAPRRGRVLDRSLGGLRLGVNQAVPAGAKLAVRTADAPKGTPWVEVEVRSCRQWEGGWELGCRFVRTPPSSILMLFG